MNPFDQSTRSALRALKELYDEGLISDRTWQNQQEEVLAAASNRASGAAAAAAALGNEQAAPVGAQPRPKTPTSNANATAAGTSTGLQQQAARDFDPEATPSPQPSSPQRQHQRRRKRPPQRFTHEEELARPQCLHVSGGASHARSPSAAPDAPSVKEGVLVWAYVQGHPWWPATVVAANPPRPSGELTVLFMGTGDKATIKRKENVVLMNAVDRKDMEARARNHPRMGGEVQRSFEAALRYLAETEQWRPGDLKVTDVLYKRKRHGEWQYLVEWAATPYSASWQPATDLPKIEPSRVRLLPRGPDGLCCAACDMPHDSHPVFGTLVLCDGPCHRGWHIGCMRPARSSIPDGDWFCASCSAAWSSPPPAGAARSRAACSAPAVPDSTRDGAPSPSPGRRQSPRLSPLA